MCTSGASWPPNVPSNVPSTARAPSPIAAENPIAIKRTSFAVPDGKRECPHAARKDQPLQCQPLPPDTVALFASLTMVTAHLRLSESRDVVGARLSPLDTPWGLGKVGAYPRFFLNTLNVLCLAVVWPSSSVASILTVYLLYLSLPGLNFSLFVPWS